MQIVNISPHDMACTIKLGQRLIHCDKMLANQYRYMAKKCLPATNKEDTQENLRIILEQVRNHVHHHKEKQQCYEFDFMDMPPELETENPGLSDAVELEYSTEFSRHTVAARNIKPGEIIGVQKPCYYCQSKLEI